MTDAPHSIEYYREMLETNPKQLTTQAFVILGHYDTLEQRVAAMEMILIAPWADSEDGGKAEAFSRLEQLRRCIVRPSEPKTEPEREQGTGDAQPFTLALLSKAHRGWIRSQHEIRSLRRSA